MVTNGNKIVDASELAKQKAYAQNLEKTGFDFGFAVGSAFVESMRNTYYHHTGTALDEIIDNGIEAGASNIHVALGYGPESDSKPNAIAVIDNGHGMPKGMVRLSVAWGGTHREGSRSGFGRFGFGLPSASVNQARRYSVYSKIAGGKWNSITIDLDDIRDGKYTDPDTGRVITPETTTSAPPSWVQDYIEESFESYEHGTIVLWEKIDRLTWKTTAALTKNLLQHFGVTYRNYLGSVAIKFDGKTAEPTDPLFTTPGFRYFDLDEDRAVALQPAEFDIVSKESGEKARVRIRYASFPEAFYSIDKDKDASGSNENARLSVKRANHGIVICRMGRQIDVVRHTPWKGLENFRNDDRYWAIEIDVPAELDEELTVSNTKQGVVVSERFWDHLQKAGVEAALRNLRKIHKEAVDAKSSKKEDPSKKRPSEQSMEESAKFRRKKVTPDTSERETRAREALEQHVKRIARDTNRPVETVRKEVEEDVAKHPYKVNFENSPGAPFFRVEQVGGARILWINRSHRFFSDIYAAPSNTRQVRAGIEVLLFSIGEAELDAQGNPDRRTFYSAERSAWSENLSTSLELLGRFVSETDVSSDSDGENVSSQAA